MDIHLIAGDCLENIKLLAKEGILVDAVITDPPYHLKSIAQRFTAGTGFLGHHWDGGDISFRPETWATIASVLKPGGFLLAFGGTRTHHRIWSAIEDAGLVIFDTLSWMYGTGFPKNKALLKPAWEPICVAYKPGGKRVLNIDECRVGTETISVHDAPAGSFAGGEEGRGSDTSSYREHQGRYPSNVIHSGEAEVLETFAEYGEKAGSKGPFLRRKTFDYTSNVNIKSHKEEFAGVGYADEGTAARFFYNTGGEATCGASGLLRSGRYPSNVIVDDSDEVTEGFATFGKNKVAGGKASGPTLREPHVFFHEFKGLPADREPAFYGDAGSAKRFYYCAKPNKKERGDCRHPCMKPLALMRYLVKLVTPPSGLVLDPFAGSGSTGIAARDEGRTSILIELSPEYVADIRKRIDLGIQK